MPRRLVGRRSLRSLVLPYDLRPSDRRQLVKINEENWPRMGADEHGFLEQKVAKEGKKMAV
jgi:hypothetical protein